MNIYRVTNEHGVSTLVRAKSGKHAINYVVAKSQPELTASPVSKADLIDMATNGTLVIEDAPVRTRKPRKPAEVQAAA